MSWLASVLWLSTLSLVAMLGLAALARALSSSTRAPRALAWGAPEAPNLIAIERRALPAPTGTMLRGRVRRFREVTTAHLDGRSCLAAELTFTGVLPSLIYARQLRTVDFWLDPEEGPAIVVAGLLELERVWKTAQRPLEAAALLRQRGLDRLDAEVEEVVLEDGALVECQGELTLELMPGAYRERSTPVLRGRPEQPLRLRILSSPCSPPGRPAD